MPAPRALARAWIAPLAFALAALPTAAADAASTAPAVAPASHSLSSAALTSPAPSAGSTAKTATTTSEAPVPVIASTIPPAGRRLSSDQALAIAARLPRMQAVRHEYRGSYAGAYLKGPLRWQVSYFTRNGKKEIGQVIIDDFSGHVIEQWTGFQVAWTMARGYPGAFGRHVTSLYVWLPLCALFLIPFLNYRRPFSLLHLDLLVLLSFSVSLAFFDHAEIYKSVPLAYPPLLYLLARMLWLLRRRSGTHPPRPAGGRAPGTLKLLVPTPWLAVAVVFLIGFRVGLNVTDGNVIDVGYAGVIGAQRVVDGAPLYGHYPSDNEHGDTYGPVNYEAYVPFEQIFGFSGTWDDLPAAHAAAIFFDLLAVALLFLIGRRMRGPTLGVALAYGWVAFPFTLYTLESDSNDTLVAVFVLAALLASTYRGRVAPSVRGALAACAGLTKFAPLALAPIFAAHGMRDLAPRRRALALSLFALAFAVTVAVTAIPALTHDSLQTIYERTIEYQANRASPFSMWGLYGGLHGVEVAVEIAAVVLALLLAVVPRRGDAAGLAAAAGATLIALQLGIEHWFYLYIPWFFPLVLIALFGRLSDPQPLAPVAASAPALSSQPAVALSS